MTVYKFGGASVKDANGIRNLSEIVRKESGRLVIVVSAFGKTTNALEEVLNLWFDTKPYLQNLEKIKEYHQSVARELTGEGSPTVTLFNESLSKLKEYLAKPGREKYDTEYDQVVSYGELWSTIIVSGYLKHSGLPAIYRDIREFLITDNRYRDAGILWEESTRRIAEAFSEKEGKLFVTQGFIGGTLSGQATTLGREGSDYTAAILGNMLNASKVVVWKDVPGILNADPKWKENTVLLNEVTYREAVEMTFSGAKVIHPKTIKPLHNKSIPLYVRSFLRPEDPGTVIRGKVTTQVMVPVFVKKEKQILISILPTDFSFVIGDNLGVIFQAFTKYGVKVNLVQASAVSLNVCADDDRDRIDAMINDIGAEYSAVYNDNVELYTIRHYSAEAISEVLKGRELLVEQKTRRIIQFVLR
jgi:aspartate kinase